MKVKKGDFPSFLLCLHDQWCGHATAGEVMTGTAKQKMFGLTWTYLPPSTTGKEIKEDDGPDTHKAVNLGALMWTLPSSWMCFKCALVSGSSTSCSGCVHCNNETKGNLLATAAPTVVQ